MTALADRVPCVFCGSAADIYRLRQTVAGVRRSVCRTCAETGSDVFAADPEARRSLGCLHLTAMEMERALSLPFGKLFAREVRARAGIGARFATSAYRAECGCSTCADPLNGQSVPPAVQALVDAVQAHADAMAAVQPVLARLRHLPGSLRFSGPDGERVPPDAAVALWQAHNRRVTARPEVGPDALSSRAAAVIEGPGFHTRTGIAARRLPDDLRSSAHWALFRKYGPGFRDGDFWCRDGGEVVLLDDAERLFPASRQDRQSVASDRIRAASWRAAQSGVADG